MTERETEREKRGYGNSLLTFPSPQWSQQTYPMAFMSSQVYHLSRGNITQITVHTVCFSACVSPAKCERSVTALSKMMVM